MHYVTVTTPARLHFALIDLNGSLGRIDGSIGLAINKPQFRIVAEPSSQTLVESISYRKRVFTIVERLQAKYDFPGVHIKLLSEIPPHSGLGSGTQLALGVAQAINQIYKLNLSHSDIVFSVGRGGTSGIGINAFEHGGFIVDGGHRFPLEKSSFLPSAAANHVPPPPRLLRYPFPNWKFLIVVPQCVAISGNMEIDLFRTLCPQPKSVAERLSHLILLKLLPSILEADIHAFGDAINRIQTFGWKKIEINQRGDLLQQTCDFLLNNGAIGAGISSWGPAIFAIGHHLETLKDKTKAFLKKLQVEGVCFITSPSNIGATITRH